MMINKDVVNHIADIAMLNFSDDDLDFFTGKLDQVSEYINTINEVDTKDVKPLFQVNEDTFSIKDEEEANTTLTNEEALQNTKEQKYGYFKILKVVE